MRRRCAIDPQPVKRNPYAAFRYRDYCLLLAGNFLVAFGFQMLSVAISWDLYLQTKSATVLGNVGFVQVTPFIVFALVAGSVADRYDRRIILVGTQTLLMLSSVVLATSHESVLLIYGCLFATAVARSFQGPARLSILPHTVPVDVLHNAITWNSSAQEIASVGGPALAGLLIASTGTKSIYWIQCACSLLVLVCFLRLRYKGQIKSEAPILDGKNLFEGARFVWSDKLILSALSLDLFAVLFGGATALLPIYATDILHAGATGLGWLRAAPSVGAVIMAFTTSHVGRPQRPGRIFLWSVAAFGIATIVFGFSRYFWLSLAMLLVIGAADNISVILRNSLVQTKTPDHLRGRVLAINNIFISCSNQLGAVESGWAAALFGTIPSVVSGGTATLLVAVAFAKRARVLQMWRS